MNQDALSEAQHRAYTVFFQDLKRALKAERMTVEDLVNIDDKLVKYKIKIFMSLIDTENFYYDFSLDTLARIAAALPNYELVCRMYNPKAESVRLQPF